MPGPVDAGYKHSRHVDVGGRFEAATASGCSDDGGRHKDTSNLSTASKLFDQLVPKKPETETVFLQKYDGKYRGTDLLFKRTNPSVEAHMVGFLDKFLKELNIDWRDRSSRLSRD